MLSLYFSFLLVILLIFHVHYCIPTHEHLSIGRSATGDEHQQYTNSTYRYESESGSADNGELVHKSKRSTQQDFLSCCSEVQPRLLDGYYYKFDLPSSPQFSNHVDIVSAGYAYLLAFESNVLKKPHRYFDIDDFLNKSGIAFPPTLPLVCYDTGYSLHESPLFNYGRENLLRDLNSAEGAPLSQSLISSSATRLSATRHLNPNSGYMVQRRKMYRELGNLLQNLQRGQKETLTTKCSETIFTKTTDSIIELLLDNTIQAMSPDYSLEQFNEVAKLFLGDIIAYEMIRQACKAVCITVRFPEITTADWTPVAEKLCDASNAIRNNWHGAQLQKDVDTDKDYLQQIRPSYESNLIVSLLSNKLMVKYYEYGFRVSIHSEWTSAKAKMICNGAQSLKCIDIRNAIVLIRWKSLKPAELAASFEAPQQHIEFPKMQPPVQPYRFSQLYAKVNADLNKLQNAVHYLRGTHLQKRFYKQAGDLFRAFDSGTPPEIYAETAAEFAKSLDALNVFRAEFLHLINTISEVAMHTGETGIEKMWVLIDRNFFEMDFYMADIEEHIMLLRHQMITLSIKKNLHYDVYHAVMNVFGGGYYEAITQIREAFSKYLNEARFYVKPGNTLGKIQVLKEFIDKCGPVNQGIQIIGSNVMSASVKEATYQLGKLGPYYVQTFYLVTTYDMTYLSLFSIFCAYQKHRWITMKTMDIADVQQFLSSTLKEVGKMSEALDQAIEAVTVDAYKGRFYWIDRLSTALHSEWNADVSTSEAVRIAGKFKEMFKWNKFSVVLLRDRPHNVIWPRRENMTYFNFFPNPDYSMVYGRLDEPLRIIVNWVPDKQASGLQKNAGGFWFSVDSDRLCNVPSGDLVSYLINYQNIKSFFIWHNFIGSAPHRDYHPPSNSRPHDDRQFSPWTDWAHSGGMVGLRGDYRHCWYRHAAVHGILDQCVRHHGGPDCHRDDKVAIYALGNFAEDDGN